MKLLNLNHCQHNNKVRLLVKLTPGAAHNRLMSLEEDLLGDIILKVMVTSVPEKGQANTALIKLLSKSLKLPKSAFEIVRGKLSRSKLFDIDCGAEELLQKFQELKVL
tara:strand:- start:909 stop:1232 length:324 start_codon:yes stop_codon:yes gene_type:complete